MTTDQKLKLKEVGNFLNAVFVDEDMLDGFINAAIINTAVAEGNTAELIEYLDNVRNYTNKLIKNLIEI